MSEANEFSGKTLEEAIEKGLAQLGLVREAVSIEIVREGSRGLWGLGGEDAVVRLTPLALSPVSETESAAPLSDLQSTARQVLETLLRGVGVPSRVEALPALPSEERTAFVLNIVGDDLGVLIGRRGETLRDLEYLTRLLVAQKTDKQSRFVVDVEGYRTRRERVLRELAKRMAERVEVSRQPITLEAMPPNERRIVHLALRDHPSVRTNSIGEGDHRRVMILHK
jgi:spoIIIJ-associated protein